MNLKQTLLGCALLGAVTAAPAIAWAQSAEKPVILALEREPSTMDPVLSENSPSTEPLFLNIEEKLTSLDSNGKVIPGLGTWTVSADGKVVEFKLRHGIKFQSGDPFTSADVIFSHQRGMAGSANYRGKFRGLNHVEAPDPYTVRFIYDRPNSGILYNTSLLIGSKTYYDRVGEKEYLAHPVGTGPYKMTDYKIGQSYDLEAWDGYWGDKKPTIKKARIVIIKDEATRVAALRAGEIDVLSTVPFKEVASLEKAGFKTAYADTFPTVSLTMQTHNPNAPWSKLKVRQAMAHAVDADAIIKGLFGGIPKRYALFSPGEVGYDPDLKPFTYDPALSKKLLAEAGYPNGFTMPLSISTAYYGQKETAEAIVLYYRAVGIKVEAKVIDSVTSNAMLRERAKDPTFLFTFLRSMQISNTGDGANSLYFSLESTAPTSIYKPTNPELDHLMEEAVGTYDDTKRGELMRKVGRMIYDEVAVIPIWNARTVYAMKPEFSFTPIQHQRALLQLVDLKRNK